ncbi:MAG: hypothetical protein FWF02_05600 [Micrococcales bacterium]|nr:hypothetical protein [Micrococcales bacterium]MCL2667168.1 hypothetical protein [Micrococcales bacterium]
MGLAVVCHTALSRRIVPVAVTLLGVVGLTVPAAAAAPVPTAVPAAAAMADLVPTNALPTVQINGVVWSQAVVGNTVYAGGSFSKARPAGSPAGSNEVTRTNLLAYDITSGDLVTSFDHSLNGQVRAVAASPGGSRVYITGDFTQVDGQARTRVAAFNTADGSLVAEFHPVLGSSGLAVVATDSTVYVGGNFASVGQTAGTLTPRNHLAAFSASDGAVSGFRADANAAVGALALTPDGGRLAVGGRFTSLAGAVAYGLGSVDPTTGAAQSFPVNNVIRDYGSGSAITSLYADSTGIYGTGYAYGNGNFEGTFRANPSSGALVWLADCYGDTYSVYQMGGTVYDVSHHHDCSSTPGGFPEVNPRRHYRAGAYTLEATGTDSGSRGYPWNHRGQPAPTMHAWYPNFDFGRATGMNQGPWHVTGNGRYLAVGGEFTRVNGTPQQGLVRFGSGGGAGAIPGGGAAAGAVPGGGAAAAGAIPGGAAAEARAADVKVTVASDSFSRTVASGWGSADAGGAWVLDSPAANFSVSGGTGSMQASAESQARARLRELGVRDASITASFTMPKLANTGDTRMWVCSRQTGWKDDYALAAVVAPNGQVTSVYLMARTNGVETRLKEVPVSGLTVAGGKSVSLRLRTVGANPTTLQGRIWQTGAAEPASWMVTATDTRASLQAAGSGGVGMYVSRTTTNAPLTVRWDNVAVS